MGITNILTFGALAALTVAAPIQKRIVANLDLAVAVPLYSYPTSGVWEPTYETIQNNPDTKFDVIINPSNGPLAAPADDYLAGVTKLNSYSNVKVYGYFKIDFANRPISESKGDIDIYHAWVKSGNATLAGLFVDEAPNTLGTENDATVFFNYMTDVHGYIHETTSFEIWTNPGAIVDAKFYDIADTVTAFEDTYDAWMNPERKTIPWNLHERSTVMIKNWNGQSVGPGAQSQILIERGFKSGFVYGNEDYTEWSDAWKTFSDACKGTSY